MPAGPCLRVAGLSKRFDGVAAVDDVSLEIGHGELFAVLGPSGSGKTTLLRLIAGFETPDAGTIALDGADVTRTPPHRRAVNMMFQSYALFPHMSVAGNVGFGLRQEGLPRTEIARRVDEALDLVQMRDLARRRPDQLSGGQRQRVALARALVKRPKLLLLDEPLAALDRRLREQTRQELVRLQQRVGIAFVIVTHDQEEAMSLAGRVAVMDRGRIVQVGPPRAVYEAPATRFVATFVGDVNLIEARLNSGGRAGTPIGAIAVDPAPAAAHGERFWIAIRPEKLAISRTPPTESGLNVARGRVAQVAYLGGVSLYSVQMEGGQVLTAQAANASRDAAFAEGDAVCLSWRPDAAIVLPP